jgi:hypothetical protein
MDFPLVTRKTGIELVREELGIPLTKSNVDKAAMNGTGPKPAARFGNCDLYRPREFLDWARSLVKIDPHKESAAR